MRPRLSLRDRCLAGALATAALATLWLEGHPLEPTKAPVLTEAPLTLQGSSEAPPGLRRTTEREQHICHENSYRGNGPWTSDCDHVLVDELGNDIEITEDDPYGRWNCATMGNQICGPRYIALTG